MSCGETRYKPAPERCLDKRNHPPRLVTFADTLRSGDASQDDINDRVERWHQGEAPGDPTLREYLGFTEEQYWRWLVVGDEVLDEIMDGDA
jgi:hypothetical protein